ncbi:hypothetical protein Ddc_14282 [Ditylenchus destructor]|nr:hypothetical protein Ddc_14282 [Ditylenchus destructor]
MSSLYFLAILTTVLYVMGRVTQKEMKYEGLSNGTQSALNLACLSDADCRQSPQLKCYKLHPSDYSGLCEQQGKSCEYDADCVTPYVIFHCAHAPEKQKFCVPTYQFCNHDDQCFIPDVCSVNACVDPKP